MVGCVQKLRQKLNATQMQFHIPSKSLNCRHCYTTGGHRRVNPTLAELRKLLAEENFLDDRLRVFSALEFCAASRELSFVGEQEDDQGGH